MASTGPFFFFFVVVLVVSCVRADDESPAFAKLVCEPQNVGQYGQPSLLHCVVQTKHAVADVEIRSVSWTKGKKPLWIFHKGKVTQQQRGYGMARPSWNNKDMNVSLLIANTTLPHGGEYVCTVMTNRGDEEVKTSLTVTARYSSPVITRVADAALTCEAGGGYPEGSIRWVVDGEDRTQSSKTQARRAESGLLHLSSTLTTSGGSNFHCVVFNATGGKEAESSFNNPSVSAGQEAGSTDPHTDSRVIAPVVVIGSLIVGLLLLLLLRRYRRRSRAHHQEVCRIDPDVEEGATGRSPGDGHEPEQQLRI